VIEDSETGDSWTVSLVNGSAPVDVLLLDDGSLLTLDEWHRMGYENTAVYYATGGTLQWQHDLEHLLSEKMIDRVPTSVSSRWWRASPLETLFSVDEQDRTLVSVTLYNEHRLTLRLIDGASWVVHVEDPGDDVKRLLRRADELCHNRHLASQEDLDLARATLHRIVDLGVEDEETARSVARLLGDLEEVDLALRVLQPYLDRHPLIPGISEAGEWLWITAARLYDDAGWLDLRDRTYLALTHAAPTSWTPVNDWGQRLLIEKQERAALQALDNYFQQVVARHTDESEVGTAGANVGRLAARAGHCAEALPYLDAALQARSYYFDRSLARTYAGCLEKEGRLGEALLWWQRIASDLASAASPELHERERIEAEEALRRLEGNPSGASEAPPGSHH
jgi:hypothetical protein